MSHCRETQRRHRTLWRDSHGRGPSRSHIDFVQAQALPWRRGLYGGSRPDVEVRVLSMDDESGAASLILRYPPGWRRDDAEFGLADEDIFVLAGELAINGIVYRRLCYGRLPAGFLRESAAAPQGAVVLTFVHTTMIRAAPLQRRGAQVDFAWRFAITRDTSSEQ